MAGTDTWLAIEKKLINEITGIDDLFYRYRKKIQRMKLRSNLIAYNNENTPSQ
jgi:hypothetical protein